MTQTIAVHSASAIEYTWPTQIEETTGKDISGDPIYLSLGTFDAPATWAAPDVLTRPTTSTALVQMLIGASLLPAVGDYWLWTKITDSPETVPRRGARVTIT